MHGGRSRHRVNGSRTNLLGGTPNGDVVNTLFAFLDRPRGRVRIANEHGWDVDALTPAFARELAADLLHCAHVAEGEDAVAGRLLALITWDLERSSVQFLDPDAVQNR